MAKTGWEVKQATVSERNGGLHVVGINHDSTDPLFRVFHWDIKESASDPRYDFSGCAFSPAAQLVYNRLTAKK